MCERNRDPSRTTTPEWGLHLWSCWSCNQWILNRGEPAPYSRFTDRQSCHKQTYSRISKHQATPHRHDDLEGFSVQGSGILDYGCRVQQLGWWLRTSLSFRNLGEVEGCVWELRDKTSLMVQSERDGFVVHTKHESPSGLLVFEQRPDVRGQIQALGW